MAAFVWHIFSSFSLLILGLYHLISATLNHLKSSPRDYSAKPYHPLPLSSPRLKHLPLYLILFSLLLSSAHQALIISSLSDPLLKGNTAVHHFTSLHSAALLFLFFLLSLSLLLPFSFPSQFLFASASALFFLQSSASSTAASLQTSGLEAKCDSISSRLSSLSALLCFILACHPKLFVLDLGLGGSLCLQGLWVLQTALSLYVEGFIPQGCHRLLDVSSGVQGSTRCDLEESRLRAAAILDLVFVFHLMFVLMILFVAYAVVAKSVGVRSFGSYEPLSTTTTSGLGDSNHHVQLKTLAGTQA